MDWIDSIKEIRKAQDNNRLVIFVGSGVSKNSGLPTWSELIKNIAIKIKYFEKCKQCDDKTKKCSTDKCEKCFEFTQDEFLRIPEYFYQKNKSRGVRNYYDFIINELSSEQKSNPIDDEIMNIRPHHIITTNYDSLLEDSKNIYTDFYEVVVKDSDLLSRANDRYIIKMHGDLKEPETIILKESDYINYEQQHVLITTFIKSLLTNHTFLFLGYSLNDYNLNLIIGWINYFSEIHNVQQRPNNFLIQEDSPSKFEQNILKSKKINVIGLDQLPNDIQDKITAPTIISADIGKRLYSYLKCISTPSELEKYIPLEQLLEEKYKTLESYARISYHDFRNVYSFGRMDANQNMNTNPSKTSLSC